MLQRIFNPRTEPVSPTLARRSLPLCHLPEAKTVRKAGGDLAEGDVEKELAGTRSSVCSDTALHFYDRVLYYF